ncbi:hypothetical protein [Maribacter litoralis]|uniref:hypothetical protein n=1 Tax=Maribacter litoralis TaxID=2059726 RepID=UPI003F5CF38C
MKYIMLVLIMVCQTSISQMTIKEDKNNGTIIGSAFEEEVEMITLTKFDNDLASFKFRMERKDKNPEMPTLNYWYFTFEDIENSMNDLFNLISKSFIKTPSSYINLEFSYFKEKSSIRLNFKKDQFQTYMQFTRLIKKSFGDVEVHSIWLTQQQVNHLFGK